MVVTCSSMEKAEYSPPHFNLAAYGRCNRITEIKGTLSQSLHIENKILQSIYHLP